ncbi:hypothetical protein EV360DRAFT_65750 [Lentinula raphanica]|nr:hypothetical protein EV360DRAFT_65750 [Lentinula raphanica]
MQFQVMMDGYEPLRYNTQPYDSHGQSWCRGKLAPPEKYSLHGNGIFLGYIDVVVPQGQFRQVWGRLEDHVNAVATNIQNHWYLRNVLRNVRQNSFAIGLGGGDEVLEQINELITQYDIYYLHVMLQQRGVGWVGSDWSKRLWHDPGEAHHQNR